jgi:tRNA (guanine-N7-)-methyltransferase
MAGRFKCSMRQGKTLPEREAGIEFVPASITQPLDFSQLFSRAAPLEIDLGCGDGTFLTAVAAENPEHNFLGIERLLNRVRSLCRKAARAELRNVRVLRIDTTYALAHLISAGTVAVFHLLFPDPWPKRRHHRRRAVTREFLAAIDRALVPHGLLHIATDHAEYFDEIERASLALFTASREEIAFPQSTFERRFAATGAPIHRLVLRKISPAR